MSWKQSREFNLAKMGTRKGWCLRNVRLGFGIETGKFSSAKADMESQEKNGTLHAGRPPIGLSVPVYIDTESKFEHVVAYTNNKYYSDGVEISRPSKTFGWGELCDGRRVVKWIDEGFLPAKGYWCLGDMDKRINELSSFMYRTFPSYTSKKALGSYYGKYLESSIKQFQKRTNLQPVDGCVGKKTYAMLKKYGFTG